MLTPQPDSALMLDALLAQFVDHAESRAATGIADRRRWLPRFERLLDRRVHRITHVACVYASALGVSADHLSAVARSHYGISAKAMIERRLFAEAVRLLAATTAVDRRDWRVARL